MFQLFEIATVLIVSVVMAMSLAHGSNIRASCG
jgi:hypothetical protein